MQHTPSINQEKRLKLDQKTFAKKGSHSYRYIILTKETCKNARELQKKTEFPMKVWKKQHQEFNENKRNKERKGFHQKGEKMDRHFLWSLAPTSFPDPLKKNKAGRRNYHDRVCRSSIPGDWHGHQQSGSEQNRGRSDGDRGGKSPEGQMSYGQIWRTSWLSTLSYGWFLGGSKIVPTKNASRVPGLSSI